MIYARVDCELRDHPRAQAAGAAMATWLFLLLYTRRHELDGYVPDAALRGAWVGIEQARLDVEVLVTVGLCKRAADGCKLLGYAKKNETKLVIDERREAQRTKKAKWRKSSTNPSTNVSPVDRVAGTPLALSDQREEKSKSQSQSQAGTGPSPVDKPSESGPERASEAAEVGDAIHRLPPSEWAMCRRSYFDAYVAAARKATGKPDWSLVDDRDLEKLIKAGCINAERLDVEGWITKTVAGLAAYVASMSESERGFGWTLAPRTAQRWINDGRPSKWKAPRSSTNGAPKQTLDGADTSQWGTWK